MFIKICGVTSTEDALRAVQAGADAVGLNLVPTSKRFVSETVVRAVGNALSGRAQRIGVVADRTPGELQSLREVYELDVWQLTGTETPEDLGLLQPQAFKAVHIGGPEDVARCDAYGGKLILVDAKVPGHLGGTGQTFDWTLVAELARRRRLILAGGLTPENVAEAVEVVRPWGVDVASGVEYPGEPGRKDPERMRRFVENARSAVRG